jgi:hypothetical protein
MSNTGRTILSSSVVALGASLAAATANAASPNLSGTYRCQPAPAPCLWPGQKPTITQSGTSLQIKSDQGDVSAAKMTSDTTISAGATFNSIGIIRPDHSIDWSDGTRWHKK